MKRVIVAGALLAMTSACGGGTLSPEDAQRAWGSTEGAMGGQGATANGLSVSVPCAEGGKVKWKSDLGDLSFGVGGGANVGWTYTLVFRGCKYNGVKISGKMDYTFEVVAKEGASYNRWGYSGKLRYAGDIKGSCKYEMNGEVAVDDSGVSVSYSGSICGHDAYATLSVGDDNVNYEAGGDTQVTTM